MDQLLSFTRLGSLAAEWDQEQRPEGDFHGVIASQYRFAQHVVPILNSPSRKGSSVNNGSIHSNFPGPSHSHSHPHSHQRSPPSVASHLGFDASSLNVGPSFNPYTQNRPSSRYSHSSSGRSESSRSSSSDHDSLPSLANTIRTAETGMSVSTAFGETHLPTLVRLEEEDDALVDRRPSQPSSVYLECAFWFLECVEVFQTIPEWKTHCLSHFHRNAPPTSAMCPLCAATFSGRDAWDQRMNHVYEIHHSHGYGLEGSRPDFALVTWLWKKRVIDDATHKDLLSNFDNSRSAALSTVTEGRARETRREPRGNRRNF